MPRLTIRFDDALHERLIERAHDQGRNPSAYLRLLLARDLGLEPDIVHERFDELHATAIQTLAILAASVGRHSPETLTQGMADARTMLRDRGLLDPEQDR